MSTSQISTFSRTTSARPSNDFAIEAMLSTVPVLVDVLPAGEVIPGFDDRLILTSGPPLDWEQYTGGQLRAILGAIVYEGHAATLEEARNLLATGAVRVDGCHDYGCVGSLAGVTSASMPVLVVEDARTGRRAFCSLYEGDTPARLNYGVWDDRVSANLRHLAEVVGPALGSLIRRLPEGLPLLPIMQRAVNQGDELHSRNTAASLLFTRSLMPVLVDATEEEARVLIQYLGQGDYFFLRPAMAASKLMADAMSGVPGSSLVTAMAFSCSEFGIRVSGLGDRWFRGPLQKLLNCKLAPGFTTDDIEVMGGESVITECCGLGGFAQAAAFTLQDYQGGPEAMVQRTLEMYSISHVESPHFKIPFFGFRGSPTGVDVSRVAATGVTPVLNIGIAGRDGGQIGAGVFRAPIQPFIEAHSALRTQSPDHD